jgi:hypothetical protein
MHCANFNSWEEISPGAEELPASPDDPVFLDEDPGWVLPPDAAGTVVADEAVVAM